MENVRKQEQQKSGEIALMKRQLSERENEESQRIDRELNAKLASINSQRQALNQAESNELAQRLKDVQNVYVSNQLARYNLASATIPGIGTELKKRLLASGIGTAADIRSIHIGSTGWGHYSHEIAYIEVQGRGKIHVDGIGSKKAGALWSWRQSLESRYRKGMPQSLAGPEESAIRSKYQAQQHSISLQETDAKRTATRKSDDVRRAHQKEQDNLSTQLQTHREQSEKALRDLEQKIAAQERNVSQKDWLIAKAQRDFEAYRQITFAAYLRRILGIGTPFVG
jgi:DNA-binding helix-hairpin-helix protein with protein kinase domain